MSAQGKAEGNALPKPIYIRNFPCPNLPGFAVKNMESVFDNFPRDGDIILCSYPKTGTTWMQYIIWQILHKEEAMPSLQDMLFKCFPFVERTGIDAIEGLPSPRCYKTHFPMNMLKVNKRAKYIYIHRNPLDTLASYFYFSMSVRRCLFNFDDFYEGYISGNMPYGDYFDHVLSFEDHKDNSYLQIFSYEDLHRDTGEQVLRLAKFLGDEYHKDLIDDETRLQSILDKTRFGHMKKRLEPDINMKENTSQTLSFNLFRNGVVGDGKKLLSPEQVDGLYQSMLAKMKGTHYMQLWS